jgi:hypothetical protein
MLRRVTLPQAPGSGQRDRFGREIVVEFALFPRADLLIRNETLCLERWQSFRVAVARIDARRMALRADRQLAARSVSEGQAA